MTSKNNASSKTVAENTEAVEREASVPQQSAGEKVTIVKGAGVDGKDVIVVSEEDGETGTDEMDNSIKGKFLRAMRNKKVWAGLGTVAAIVIFGVVKSSMSNDDETDEDDVTITTETDDEGRITSVTVTANDAITDTE